MEETKYNGNKSPNKKQTKRSSLKYNVNRNILPNAMSDRVMLKLTSYTEKLDSMSMKELKL